MYFAVPFSLSHEFSAVRVAFQIGFILTLYFCQSLRTFTFLVFVVVTRYFQALLCVVSCYPE